MHQWVNNVRRGLEKTERREIGIGWGKKKEGGKHGYWCFCSGFCFFVFFFLILGILMSSPNSEDMSQLVLLYLTYFCNDIISSQ